MPCRTQASQGLTPFGATGRTGRHIVEKALEEDHEVTAFVRRPEMAPWSHERLNLLQGDGRRLEDVRQAVDGADAVISVLHSTENKPGRPISQATANIIQAMEARGVRWLAASCGAGVSFPQDEPGPVNRVIGWLVKTLAKYIYEDMNGAAQAVTQSDLEWTLVRVPVLNDDPAKRKLKVGYVGKGTGARLSREDMAAFMLEQADSDEHLHDVPVIAN